MIENSIVYRDFRGKYEYLPLSKAEGSLLWDRQGKRYIDFTSGWNVTNLGWNQPEINEAIIAQTKKNVQGLLWGSDPIQEEYAAALTAVLPDGLDACMKATGGTESIEMAIKVARVYTGRKKVIGFKGFYHGQLFASLALGARAETRGRLNPIVPEITPIGFPHDGVGEAGFKRFTDELEALLAKKDVAAVVAEPGIMTGGGLALTAYPGFLPLLRKMTNTYGTLLIVDEVGTGFSRTGKLFGIEHDGITPDMVVFAKAISNGAAAIGTTVGRSEIFEPAFAEAILISTFGWTPIACAAALKTLQIHQRDKTWEMAEQKGTYIRNKLEKMRGDVLLGVCGQGMELGVQFKDAATCERVQHKAFANGLHVIVGSEDTMQLMPPLTTSPELLEEGLGVLGQAVLSV